MGTIYVERVYAMARGSSEHLRQTPCWSHMFNTPTCNATASCVCTP